MQKKIKPEQLRVGMYIEQLGCSWMDHPFLRKSFLLSEASDLKTILATRMSWVCIDTDKGLDVIESAAEKSEAAFAHPAPKPEKKAQQPRVSCVQEAQRAVMICSKSKQAVASMFQESRMGHALNAEDALPIVEEISNSVLRNPGTLISLARLKNKDDYTYMHSVAVCALMVALAKQLGLDEEQTRQAGMAGLLHDVGKMMIPPEILNKPGRLTDEEFVIVKNHPAEGYRMLKDGIGVNDISLDVCLHHHEKTDGSGYPERLKNDQISLYAKMGAVCDIYDAITSNRPYKKGWESAESIRKMAEWSQGHFDKRIFQAFVRSVGIYPVGSLVRLESNRLAVVTEQSEKSLLSPQVKVFFSIKSNCRIAHEVIDLSQPGCKDKIASYEDPEKWNIADINELWSGKSDMSW